MWWEGSVVEPGIQLRGEGRAGGGDDTESAEVELVSFFLFSVTSSRINRAVWEARLTWDDVPAAKFFEIARRCAEDADPEKKVSDGNERADLDNREIANPVSCASWSKIVGVGWKGDPS